MAGCATATASLRRLTAATLDDTAAAVGYGSALAAVAGLFAVVAAIRIDGPASTTAVADLDAICAAGPTAARRPGLKLITRRHDLGRARASHGKP